MVLTFGCGGALFDFGRYRLSFVLCCKKFALGCCCGISDRTVVVGFMVLVAAGVRCGWWLAGVCLPVGLVS